MRKYLYISLYLLSSILFTLQAQNYRTLPLGVKEHYYRDSLGYVFPIEPDSVKFINGDTIYYHFKSLRKLNTTASGIFLNANGNSWAGRKTIIKPNGDNIWFALEGDSILIKANAKLNETWLLNNKWNVNATVTSLNLLSFCGVTDSVKVIDTDKNTFWLSKNFGFIQMPNIHEFFKLDFVVSEFSMMPSSRVNLYGSNLIAGTKTKLTDSLVYNFEVNDEFHVLETFDFYNPYTIKSIKTIKYKSYNIANRTISYSEDICSLSILGQTLGTPSNTYIVYSSKSEKKEKEEVYSLNTPAVTPLKPVFNNCIFKNSVLKFNSEGLLELSSTDNYLCLNDSIGELNFIQEIIETYIKIEKRGSFFTKSGLDGHHESKLIFAKSSEISSLDIPFICDSLLNYKTGIIEETQIQKVVNPFGNELEVKTNFKTKTVELLDYLGEVKLSQNIDLGSEHNVKIDTKNIPEGFYVVRITGINNKLYYLKVIKE